MERLACKTPEEWRCWLQTHQATASEIWLEFYKIKGRSTLTYELAVEEALCFGWIDSIIKKIDDIIYVRKFTPRKETSRWSQSNKNRVKRLSESGRMTPAGIRIIEAAQKNGCWDKSDRPRLANQLPPPFAKALRQQQQAKAFFDQLAPGYQKQFINWIAMAKRRETAEKRIAEAIRLLAAGKKLGLK